MRVPNLELSEKEIEKMQKDLSAILDYFDLLKKAPKVKMQSVSADALAWRKDEIGPQNREVAEKIIAGAPDKKDGYIKVKTIL